MSRSGTKRRPTKKSVRRRQDQESESESSFSSESSSSSESEEETSHRKKPTSRMRTDSDSSGSESSSSDDESSSSSSSEDEDRRAPRKRKRSDDEDSGTSRKRAKLTPARRPPPAKRPRSFRFTPSKDLLKRHRTASTKRERRKVSEEVGEQGALEFLNRSTGYDFGLTQASTAKPFSTPMTQGRRWTRAVAFRGRNVADVTGWDGQHANVIEAKGGGSTLNVGLSARKQWFEHKGPNRGQMRSQKARSDAPKPMAQGTERYLLDVAFNMQHSKTQDGRQGVGRGIVEGIDNGTIRYTTVQTQIDDDGMATVTRIGN